MTEPRSVVAIAASERREDKRALHYFEGVSARTAGATAIAMQRLVVPPGATAPAHRHVGYETAIYVLRGRVETRWGEGLAQSVISGAGDYLFIPPGVPHQPHNLSSTEEAEAIVARSIPDEEDHVIPYPEAGAGP